MNKLAVVIALLLGLSSWSVPGTASSPPSLSLQQKQVIVDAYQIGGERLAAIILQETSACAVVHSDVDPLACGCGGTHTGTAESVVGAQVACAFLNIDWDFSIRVAELYLEKCTLLFGERGGLTCYNVGIPKAKTLTSYQLNHSSYQRIIRHRIEEIDALPRDPD